MTGLELQRNGPQLRRSSRGDSELVIGRAALMELEHSPGKPQTKNREDLDKGASIGLTKKADPPSLSLATGLPTEKRLPFSLAIAHSLSNLYRS